MRTSCSATLATAAWFVFAGDAFAAHPLISEDTGTQGAGKFELELGNALTRDAGDRWYEFGPQLSYGVLESLDAIVRPTRVDNRVTTESGHQRARGMGDTAIDAKWRFYEAEALSLGVRTGVNAPTGDADRGPGAGKATYHALLIASVDVAPLALHANLGYTRNRSDPAERRDLGHASTAVVWSATETLRLLADVAADSNVDRTRSAWPAVALVGAIYTLREGFDIDIGYQARLNRAAPTQVLLAGATLRW